MSPASASLLLILFFDLINGGYMLFQNVDLPPNYDITTYMKVLNVRNEYGPYSPIDRVLSSGI
jgi:hypothetical protein